MKKLVYGVTAVLAAVVVVVEYGMELKEMAEDLRRESMEDTQSPAGQASEIGWLELPAATELFGSEEYTAHADGERNYTLFYDAGTYSALWVAYPLTMNHTGELKRPASWSYAQGIDEDIQVDLRYHSYNDGYARGHLIPNADRNGIQKMQRQTFHVINSVPQIQNGFNGKIWNALENAVRNSVPEKDTLYVATGPVYRTVNGSEKIRYTSAKDDDKEIPVPNYFFKVLLKVKRSPDGSPADASAIGFWFEHKDYTHSEYEKYAVSVDEIEKLTDFDFFVNLPERLEAAAESNSSWSSFKTF